MPDGLRAVLVDEAEGVRIDDNLFRFEEINPGEHTLCVYGDRGDVVVSEFSTSTASSFIRQEVMIDLCIGTELTPVSGMVTTGEGKPVEGAVVSVPSLFLETITDKDGGYKLKLPPGEWAIVANIGSTVVSQDLSIEKPETDRDVPVLTQDFTLD